MRLFQATNRQNLTRENLDTITKRNLKRETESFLRAVENKTIKTHYDKEKIENMQQNNKCRWCGDWEKT